MSFNRSQKRKLKKELSAIGQEGRATMLTGVIAEANRKALDDVAPQLLIAGQNYLYEKLFTEYVDKYDTTENVSEKADILNKLFSDIRMGYLKWIVEKDKQISKVTELKQYADEKITEEMGETVNGSDK
jgi:hypothetical protein